MEGKTAPPYTTSNLGAGKTVLILGAGMVVRPMVHYLSGHGYTVVVASRTLEKAEEVCKGANNAVAKQCDVTTESGQKSLEELVPPAHAVVSMLPYIHHPLVAQVALKHNKHFFTTSYVSEAMKKLNDEATQKGLVVINECGVDPGTDHMSAMQIIDSVRAKGGKIISFSSYCGGLPAPADNNNPFGYKLSWSPRGVLLASRNDAKFLQDGKEVVIPGAVLFDNFKTEVIPELGIEFESYPNRNSLQYIDLYGLKHTKNMVRGTYRNKGWCVTVKKMVELGLLDLEERSFDGSSTYRSLISSGISYQGPDDAAQVKAAAGDFLKLNDSNKFVLDNLEWLGLFSDEKVPSSVNTRLDAVCHLMQQKMQYYEGERDMLLMKHDFIAEYPDGKQEHLVCTLIDYGIKNGDSSMSRTVSLPVAIAIRLVLEGKFTKPGLQIPTIPELYEPILKELEAIGIKFHHRVAQ